MRRPLARLLMVAWGVGTFFISLRLFTGHVPMDLSLSGPEDPVHRRQQLMRDLKALVSKGNRTGWKEYLQYQMTGTRIWPEPGENEDRVLNQIHLVHADPAGQKLKKILMASGLDQGMVPGQSRFIDHKCPVNQCSITDHIEDAPTADAILFKDYINHPATHRPSKQIWVLFMLESPFHTAAFTGLNSQVNWTATYRTDSTMVTPYERFTPFANYTSLPDRAPRDYAKGKTKKVAWFVSNCGAPNGRHNYVEELQKYINVDIYGACGKLTCFRGSDECKRKLKTEYKFYLAFENSNCKDYITEKLYWNALENDVLPIVMGAHPDDYARLAPPKSYIHVDDFESPKALAEYLHKVDKDDDLYNSYFRWKGTGNFIDTKFWCRLCTMVHEAQRTKHHMVFDKLGDWWRGDGVCVGPQNGVSWATWRNATTRFDPNAGYFRSWTE